MRFPTTHLAGASDFPHSRQDGCARGVINPQNGHILCDAKPRDAGVIDANSFETDAAIAVSCLRKRSRKWRRERSIGDHLRSFPPDPDGSVVRHVAEVLLREVSLLHLSQTDDDTPRLIILSKIAHTCPQERQPAHSKAGNLFWRRGESEQCRPAILPSSGRS